MQTVIEKRDERLYMVVTPEDKKLLEQLCQKEGMNRSEFVRHAIRNYQGLNELSDLLRGAQESRSHLFTMTENLLKRNSLKDQLVDLLLNILTQEQKTKNAEKIDDLRNKIIDSENELSAFVKKEHEEKQK